MLMMFLLICGVYYLIYRAIIKIIREIKKKQPLFRTTALLIRVNRTPGRSIFRMLPEKQRPNPLSTCTQVMRWEANNNAPNPLSTCS